ncbi:potassium channel family protein [Streptacidiphilus cavernicola]|uniref:Potassium channel family protein n=1 Tax=Streptacidiphilus cavernicola TaxID=3342716 RepID=A0ABV6W4C1_9ACTN
MDSARPGNPGHRLHGPWLWLAVLGGFAVMVAGYYTLPVETFGPERPVLSWLSLLCALALLGGLLVRQIQLVLLDSDRGRPGVVIIMLIFLSLVVFASAYLGLSRQRGQFSGLSTHTDALYFTVVTLATIGYGDIHPTGQDARLVVMVQVGYNLVFLATGASALTLRARGRATTRIRSHTAPPHGEESDPPATFPA